MNLIDRVEARTKTCGRCCEAKPLTDFYPDSKKRHGRASLCKVCAGERARRYRQENKETIKAVNKKYQADNRERLLEAKKGRTRRLRQRILEAYGHACECCGESESQFLCVDHVNGNGAQERKAGLTGSRYYYSIIRKAFPKDEYRLLCHNCNMSLGFYGYCPHQSEKEQAA